MRLGKVRERERIRKEEMINKEALQLISYLRTQKDAHVRIKHRQRFHPASHGKKGGCSMSEP